MTRKASATLAAPRHRGRAGLLRNTERFHERQHERQAESLRTNRETSRAVAAGAQLGGCRRGVVQLIEPARVAGEKHGGPAPVRRLGMQEGRAMRFAKPAANAARERGQALHDR